MRLLRHSWQSILLICQAIWFIWLASWLIGWDAFWFVAFLHSFAPYVAMTSILLLLLMVMMRYRSGIRIGILQVSLTLMIFAPMFIPTVVQQPIQDDDLHVITYNIWGRNPRFTEAIAWIGEQEADVVVLQEIMAEYEEPRLDPIRDVYPYEAYVKGSVRILSQYPFITTSTPRLEFMSQEHGGRYVLRIEIEKDAQRYVIYGVHVSLPEQTDSHLPVDIPVFPFSVAFRYNETRRDTQIQRLIKLVEQERYPVIVAGDLNMSAWSRDYRDLANTMQDSWQGRGWGTSWPDSTAVPIPNIIPPLLRLDYIWHTHNIITLDAQQYAPIGSDHYPLSAWLRIKS